MCDLEAILGFFSLMFMYVSVIRKLICVERDSERFAVLKKRVKHHGARNVTFINDDFTCVDLEKFAGVTTVILDPSCSNSGAFLHFSYPNSAQFDCYI